MAVAGILCLLVLLCGTFAANERWHQWLHGGEDGGGGSAACAVCLFASGGCDHSPSAPPQLTLPVGLPLELLAPSPLFLPSGFRDGFRSRGPPTFVG